MSTTIPQQKISLAKKKKEEWQWAKDTIKAFIDRSEFNNKRKQDFYKWLDLYKGDDSAIDYSYVSDPYKSKDGKKRKMPAKLRNYNIIRPVIDLLLGERAKRPFNYYVTVQNPDIKDRFEEYRTNEYMNYLQQAFINEVNQLGVQTGVPSQELPSPKEFEKQVKTSYRDKRAIVGQQAIDYIIDRLELKDELQDAFFYWLITGETVTYKSVLNDEPYYECLRPMDFFYEKPVRTKYYEDGAMAGRRTLISVNEALDLFDFTDAEIDQLENPNGHKDTGTLWFENLMSNSARDDQDAWNRDREIELIHVTWRGMKKIGFVEVPGELGEMDIIEVDETYKPMPGETVDWEWVSCIYEGYQIDGSIYKGIGEVEPQRNGFGGYSGAKLPYNGRNDGASIAGIGEPYQILYNIFHYRLELSIAKNKDKIALMEMNMIPKKHGWDEEKFMYFADALGYAFIDSTAVGQNQERLGFNQWQVLDMSLGQYIAAQFNLLTAIVTEWETSLGISRQRKGDLMASDGAANSQIAVDQSNVMTNEIFRKFETVEQRDMQGLLDCSKFAWKDGKRASYIVDGGREMILDIEPGDYQEAELGLFLKNGGEEQEKLDILKRLTLEFSQNGAKPSTIAEILDSKNFAHIKEKVREVEAAEQAMNEAIEKRNQEGQERLEQMRQQENQTARDHEIAENDKERASKEKMHSEKMQVEWAKIDNDSQPQDDSIKREENQIKREKIASDERIKEKELAAKKAEAGARNNS